MILKKLGLPEQDDLTAQVKEVLGRDGKIPAIKYYREQSGAGLPEAKDFVESLEYPPHGRAEVSPECREFRRLNRRNE